MPDKGQEYQCSLGHDQYDPEGKITKCQAYRFGKPCKGVLKAVGTGSQQTNKRLAARRG